MWLVVRYSIAALLSDVTGSRRLYARVAVEVQRNRDPAILVHPSAAAAVGEAQSVRTQGNVKQNLPLECLSRAHAANQPHPIVQPIPVLRFDEALAIGVFEA